MSTFIRTCRCGHGFTISANAMWPLLRTLRSSATERFLESEWVLILSCCTNMVERWWLMYILRYLLYFHASDDRRAGSYALIDHINVIEIGGKVIYFNYRYHFTLRTCLIVYHLCDFLLLDHHLIL